MDLGTSTNSRFCRDQKRSLFGCKEFQIPCTGVFFLLNMHFSILLEELSTSLHVGGAGKTEPSPCPASAALIVLPGTLLARALDSLPTSTPASRIKGRRGRQASVPTLPGGQIIRGTAGVPELPAGVLATLQSCTKPVQPLSLLWLPWSTQTISPGLQECPAVS